MSSLSTPLVAFLALQDIFLGVCPVEWSPPLEKIYNKIRVLKTLVADADPQDDERLEQHPSRSNISLTGQD